MARETAANPNPNPSPSPNPDPNPNPNQVRDVAAAARDEAEAATQQAAEAVAEDAAAREGLRAELAELQARLHISSSRNTAQILYSHLVHVN